MLLGNLETSKQTVSPERTAEQKSVWDPDEISRLQESLNEMIREWERQNKLQFLTRFKGIPIYVDPQTGKTFVRARDIGCLANLTPRKTRKNGLLKPLNTSMTCRNIEFPTAQGLVK